MLHVSRIEFLPSGTLHDVGFDGFAIVKGPETEALSLYAPAHNLVELQKLLARADVQREIDDCEKKMLADECNRATEQADALAEELGRLSNEKWTLEARTAWLEVANRRLSEERTRLLAQIASLEADLKWAQDGQAESGPATEAPAAPAAPGYEVELNGETRARIQAIDAALKGFEAQITALEVAAVFFPERKEITLSIREHKTGRLRLKAERERLLAGQEGAVAA